MTPWELLFLRRIYIGNVLVVNVYIYIFLNSTCITQGSMVDRVSVVVVRSKARSYRQLFLGGCQSVLKFADRYWSESASLEIITWA